MMNNLNSSKSFGTFTIEFAFVGVFLAFIIVFSEDVLNKLLIKSRLESLSYSLVTLIKEQKGLYNNDVPLLNQDMADNLYIIAKNMLKDELYSFNDSKFGIDVSLYFYHKKSMFHAGSIICKKNGEKSGIYSSYKYLYKVSVCYVTNDWFLKLSENKKFSKSEISTHSVAIAQ